MTIGENIHDRVAPRTAPRVESICPWACIAAATSRLTAIVHALCRWITITLPLKRQGHVAFLRLRLILLYLRAVPMLLIAHELL